MHGRTEFLTHLRKRPLSVKFVSSLSQFGLMFGRNVGYSAVPIEESLRVRVLSIRID
jgi:hypothetical protein